MVAAEPTMRAKCVAEFVGTFLLVFTVGCNVLSGNAVWGGVSIASVLMVAIYALGGISGANFNPAVSLALGLSKARDGPGMAWRDVFSYMGVQVAAGICASFCYYGLFQDSFVLAPAPGFHWVQAGWCEVAYTFMLCFVVLNVAAVSESKGEVYGLAIGFVIVAGAYGAGAVSGGCFNPAVAIGIDASGAMKGSFGHCVLYVICEFFGAFLAEGVFRALRPDEYAGGERSPYSKIISEFIGTYMLVLTVGLNVLGKSPAGAFSIAASLMSMIYALGDVSGAHFNPAVTIAIFASGRCKDQLSKGDVLDYILAQLFGGILAAQSYVWVRNDKSFALGPGGSFSFIEVAVAEAVFTAVLCYVVLCVAVSKTTASKTMYGLAIGACVTVGGNAIGGISGGCLNPAVAWGIATSNRVLRADGSFVAALLYTLFEIAGGLIAVGVYMVTHRVDFEAIEDDSKQKV